MPDSADRSLCTFCLRYAGDPTPWCPDNPGYGCQYGLSHEYPVVAKLAKQAKKVDTGLCTKCGLHARNPASVASECKHEYPVT